MCIYELYSPFFIAKASIFKHKVLSGYAFIPFEDYFC